MSEVKAAHEQALDGYKPTSKTIWHARGDAYCEVRSLNPPPEEINKRESCGRQKVKGFDPHFAAKVYRDTRKLPEDWPVEVVVFAREPVAEDQKPNAFEEMARGVLPAPPTEETQAAEETAPVAEEPQAVEEAVSADEPKAVEEIATAVDEPPLPADASLDVDGETALEEDDPANPDA